jgi:hypothetical protein
VFKQLIVGMVLVGAVYAQSADAATVCVGKDFDKLTAAQKRAFQTELRKRKGLKSGDDLGACDSSTARAAKQPSKPKADQCKTDCDTATSVTNVICAMPIPVLSEACAVVKPGLPIACPAACASTWGN